MYVHGGMYIDIKAEQITPLIVTILIDSDRRKEEGRGVTYSVVALTTADYTRVLLQTLMAIPFFSDSYSTSLIAKSIEDYHIAKFYKFYELISDVTQESDFPGVEKPFSWIQFGIGGMNLVWTEEEEFDYYLLSDIDRPLNECHDGADRDGFCCALYKGRCLNIWSFAIRITHGESRRRKTTNSACGAWYGVVLYSTVQYSTVQYSTVQYSTVQYSTVQYSTVQYSTVQYSTVQYSTVQYSTVQYSTVQYSTVQYGTVQ